MESRVIWLVPGVWSLVAAVSLACGSTDPGEINVEPGHGRSRTGPDLMDASLPPPMDHQAPPPVDAHDSGADRAHEASKDAGGVKDVSTVLDTGPSLFGATAYKSSPVATSAVMLHSMKGASTKIGAQTPCLSCHNGATMGTVQFLFAGSIYTDATGATGAADTEVRVLDAKGKGTSAYSDANGNFWAVGVAALATPGLSGARNAVSEQIMTTLSLSSGDCNTCHNGTTQPGTHLP